MMRRKIQTISWLTALLALTLLWVSPAMATDYELYIAGKQVTDANCNDLSGIKGVTVGAGGVFKYDPKIQTLVMKSVTVSNEEGAIRIGRDLKIWVSGTNRVESKNGLAIDVFAHTVIDGDGSLTATSINNTAICFNNENLTISNITFEATGRDCGITSMYIGESGMVLTIKNANVIAKGAKGISNISDLITEGCEIVEPAGGKFDETKDAVVDAEGNVAKEVKIERSIPVTGVTVTPKTVDLTVGKTEQLTISVEPATASNQRYTCQSDNESVATVTNTGLITAVSVGTANITITTEDGNKTETCTVTVSQSTSPDNPNAVEETLFAKLSVAPNPFSSQLRISHKEAINARYAFLDARGVILYQGALEGTETTLNTENLKAGIYLLRLSADNGATKTITVVKDR